MILESLRYFKTDRSTMSQLFIDGVFNCFILEPVNCIPEGIYDITLRKIGGKHKEYKGRFSGHKGMLWIRNVPNWRYILYHIGNWPDDTDGCQLPGMIASPHTDYVGNSKVAYWTIYPKIAKAIESGEAVHVHIRSILQ
jgi:hypothetical protein